VNAVEKNKPEKREDKLPSRLLFASSFEFISPHPVEECAFRLHELEHSRRGLFLSKAVAYVFSDQQNEYRFYVRDTWEPPFVWAIGELSARNEISTSVSGQIGIATNRLFPSIMYFPPLALSVYALASNAVDPTDKFTFIVFLWIICIGAACTGLFLALYYTRFIILKTLKINLEITA
jgi:hypothetical protein